MFQEALVMKTPSHLQRRVVLIPASVTWGPNSASLTSQISKDAVYVSSSSTSSTGQELSRRLDGNTLKIEDGGDNDFDDLTITPSDGRFTSDSRWVADW